MAEYPSVSMLLVFVPPSMQVALIQVMRSSRYWCGGIETGRDSKATFRMNPPFAISRSGAETSIEVARNRRSGYPMARFSPVGRPMMVWVKLLVLKMPIANPCRWPDRIRTVVCCAP